jgi:kinesin family member 22
MVTFTMQGDYSSKKKIGLIPRTIKTIFKLFEEKKKTNEKFKNDNFDFEISYLEIYNEKVYDLLELKEKECLIREDINHNIIIKNLKIVKILNFNNFDEIFKIGMKNRKIAKTNLNYSSNMYKLTLKLI